MNIFKKLITLLNREIPTDLLVKRGLTVGDNFNRQQGCFIDPSHCFLITIGNNVTMSIRVTLLAHDASTKKLLGYTKIGQIRIDDNVFVGANTTILPNVKIGKNSIIGSGSLVTHDIPDNSVAVGVPAKVICSTEEFKQKNFQRMMNARIFDSSYKMYADLAETKKDELRKATSTGIAFIE